MRHAVTDLGAFGVVEPIHRTNEVARDAPDALESHSISHLAVNDGQMVEPTQGCRVHDNYPFSLKHLTSNRLRLFPIRSIGKGSATHSVQL